MTPTNAVMGQVVGETMRLTDVPDTPLSIPVGKRARNWRDYQWKAFAALGLVHVGAMVGLVMGAPWQVWVLCGALYFIRMFAVTGGYHRYFSHRTYKTSRWFQFVLALVAETSSQRGALWWAAHHRDHHKYSDTKRDVHSPARHGFWHSHLLWIYDEGNSETNYARVHDLTKYPELIVLDKLWLVPPVLLGFGCWLVYGWAGLFVGFMLSTVLLWHGTFLVNSLAHVIGRQRYETGEDSKNSALIALVTMGEGWHNNHHYFMNSTRQGFFWWEIDMTYYILKALSWMGVVWDLKAPPARVYEPGSMKSAGDEEPAAAA